MRFSVHRTATRGAPVPMTSARWTLPWMPGKFAHVPARTRVPPPGCRAGRGPGDARLPLTIRLADLLDGEVDDIEPLDSNQAGELLRGIGAGTSPADHFHSKWLNSNRIRR